MFNYIRYAVAAAIIAVAIYFVIDAVRLYASATGNVWQRLLAAGRGSATILWQRFIILCTSVVSGLSMLAEYLGDGSLSQTIQANLKPEYVAWFTIAVAIVTVWARNRTMSEPPAAKAN